MDFSHFGFRPEILRAIKDLGFLHPTPIQADSIPHALAGRDLLACAATGSGKTASFVLPMLQKLAAKPRGGTRALVLTPTRELCAQINDHLAELAVHTPIRGAAVYGGVGMGPQEHALRSGVDIVVATPGRLIDHMRSSYVDFGKLEFLVLDEADRMLDMGFLPDIRRILRRLPERRQTLFFSATMPPPIAQLSKEMLKNPAFINQERRAAPPAAVRQAVYPVTGGRKAALLMALLQRDDIRNVIVFTRTKQRTNRLCEALEKTGYSAARLHGNRTQSQREKALDGFRDGKVRILVATDVASRGIDVEELSHVINFDVPHVPEDYIHRVGRTGRAGATGDAITFVSPEEEADLRQIEKAVGSRLPRVKLPDFDYAGPDDELKRKRGGGSGGGRRGGDDERPDPRPVRRGPGHSRGQEGGRSEVAQRRNLRERQDQARDAARRSHELRGGPSLEQAPPFDTLRGDGRRTDRGDFARGGDRRGGFGGGFARPGGAPRPSREGGDRPAGGGFGGGGRPAGPTGDSGPLSRGRGRMPKRRR
jgi:ATP-dependent RNA helicase RhlE